MSSEMTDRQELLRAVAECAPEEWAVEISDIHDYDHLQLDTVVLCLQGNDIEDAPAIIAMLDEIERRDYFTEVGNNKRPVDYFCVVEPDGISPQETYRGATRAEAVARAFVAVMSTERGKAADSQSEPSETDPAKDQEGDSTTPQNALLDAIRDVTKSRLNANPSPTRLQKEEEN